MRFNILALICIIAFAITSCNNSICNNSVKTDISQQPNAFDGVVEDNSEISSNDANHGVEDIFTLKLSQNQIDSIFERIENTNIDDPFFGGATKSILKDFFSNIDKDTLIQNLEYSKNYEFNRYPTEYKSDVTCDDTITLSYSEDEGIYRLNIENSFYVEEFGCSEHTCCYVFRVKDNQIELIDIIYAG